MTHNDLIDRGKKWLRKFPVIITEMASAAFEEPDILGMNGYESILIECKSSRSDFKQDLRKFSRRSNLPALGDKRYYLTASGLLKPEEIKNGWGLLECKGKRIYKIIESNKHDVCHRSEKLMLISALRRIGNNSPEGISIKCYTHQTKCRASISVSENKHD